jgi:hypothetical protein
MKDYILDKLKTRREVYLKDSNIILEDYRKEREKIEEYDGRQLLEMLQNADDEAITEKEKTCFIKLTDNELVIANNGQKFSKGGIESLMYSNISPKLQDQNKVGQKGLGFRSVLSWANKITIKSYDFAVEFSENNAKEFLKSLIKEKPEIVSQLNAKEKKEPLPIATLRCPKVLEHIPTNLTEYDTYIVIELKENLAKDVQEQIKNEINKEVLLFLNNLEKIIVDSPEKTFSIEKKSNDGKILIREFNFRTSEKLEKEWNVNTKIGSYNGKNYELKIAWNENLDDRVGRLYSYFKTNVKFPFPALIHGTFDLTSDRNHFSPKSGHNTFLINELMQLLIETAIEISQNEVSYKPLKLLGIYEKENFDTFFEDNNFTDKLKDKIRENQVYPTVSNKYISYIDKPVFYHNNYPGVLPSDKFADLLLFTDDDGVKEIITWLGYYKYDLGQFFRSISEISHLLSVENRARLISYIVSDFSASNIDKSKLPNIFIDLGQNVIPSNSEIFLPPSGEKIEIPVKLNLKIINSELFVALKQIFGSENAEVIEDRLKFFYVKVYRFGEVFRRIVVDFNNNPINKFNRRESIKDLISNLYELYQSNKDKGSIDINIPSNITIPILNKNNGETKVGNVYLGKDYSNKLGEILFEYDKSKLVGSPRILGLESAEYTDNFLLWLGVAKLPRRKIVPVKSDEYFHFALKQFPYKEKKIYEYDATLNSYNKLSQKGYWINEIFAETIENLDDLLSNNSNENILYWLKSDNRIIEAYETNSNSYIKFSITSKQYYANIRYSEMPSFLLWKINQISWIKTVTEKKSKPTNCCISKTITKEFSPFIEIPKINHDNQLFKEEKISKEDIEYYLTKVGVNKEISDFSTATIYSMLSNLKTIDSEGKKAKLIYRELTENLDVKNIDFSSKEYKVYIETGFVYCKKNGAHSYQPIKSAYYVEDKTFGEDIINQFYTIEIDRRSGAKIVNAIFGVQPLTNLEFYLKSLPVTHHLNKFFQKEIDELKPYFYAFRIAKDTDERELKWIKNSRITLCTQIHPQYKHNEELRDFELKPYEFIYIEKKGEVYLLISDEQNYNTFTDLQSDYNFADSVAEIYSSILKVDSHRVSFSRLFEANTEKKKHIINTELDDKNLEKLKLARKKLNVVDEPKIQFWFSILSALDKHYEYRKYEDSEFENLIFTILGLNLYAYKLNYEDINDFPNFPIIIKVFNDLKMDIPKFNENSTITLNIIPYFLEELKQIKIDLQKNFEILLFNSLKTGNISEKESFIDIQLNYENHNQYNLKNSIHIDIKEVFFETIRDKYQIDLYATFDGISLVDRYNNNVKEICKQIDQVDKNLLYELIENSNKLRSLVFFGEYDPIIKEYENFSLNTPSNKEIKFNNKTYSISNGDLGELYALISCNDPVSKIENITTLRPEIIEDDDRNDHSNKPARKHNNTDLETLGFIGEVVVFESLKSNYNVENVIWDSEFAKKAGINPKGDDNKHYDLKYKNRKDQWIFVEVKTVTSKKLEFKISKLEVNFGIANKNNYEIMIVTNALNDKNSRRIKQLTNPFKFGKDESFTNNPRFLVKDDKFTVELNERT